MTGEEGPFDLVLNGGFVFDGKNRITGAKSIGVRNGRITEISDTPLSGRQTIDAHGHWVGPGLIESHIHLFDPQNSTDPGEMARYVKSDLAKNFEMFLSCGFTTIKSVGDPVPELLATRTRLQSGELIGPRLLMTGVGITAPDGHPGMTIYGSNAWYRGRAAGEVDTVQDARALVTEMAELGMDAIKLLLQGSCRCRGEPEYKWHGQIPIVRLKSRVLEAAIDEAHRHGLKATVHTFEQERAIEALECGADGLEHGIVGEDISDDRVIDLLLTNNASYVPTLWVYPRPEAMRNLALVHDAGVRVVLGSDSFAPTITVPGVITGTFGANSIVEAERMVEAGLTPLEVLRSATSNAATHLEREDMGLVTTGTCADLVMFRDDPTESIAAWQNPLAVIVEGKVVINHIETVPDSRHTASTS
ncbi:amidohydrolase family protein [Sphingobium sp. EM0848]|uniref:amidohydrolase family protein n=1 Tax=Sphingobium sp. EM0848 TaxID=2743473 RepID=UPI00159C4BAE